MTMVLVTPTYRRDKELFSELRRSILDCGMDNLEHVAVVPQADVSLFQNANGANLHVRSIEQFLGSSLRSVQLFTQFLPGKLSKIQYLTRSRTPYLVRGWIVQQLVKLAVSAELQADVALLVDSDVSFLRPPGEEELLQLGKVRLYEKRNAIGQSTQPQRGWIDRANRSLGLESQESLSAEDYICGVVTWAPSVVREMLGLIEKTANKPWPVALSAQTSISECMLYGRYASVFDSSSTFTSEESGCISHWEPRPLTERDLLELQANVSPAKFSVQLQSTATMDLQQRREIIQLLRASL